ncbi:2321_t:CDS:2 [Paraglomus occultum]|uniref:2321_t:CDS:1 n=1 Tax=Paraglomus occultum TaxID=144539 RepID=A0A9N9AXW4_9GLOM|nr:2321_t:CDS:2 [Paraglomus occultum]
MTLKRCSSSAIRPDTSTEASKSQEKSFVLPKYSYRRYRHVALDVKKHQKKGYKRLLHSLSASLINVIPDLYTKAKKTNDPIKTFRIQATCSKKKVSKLAVVRARIRRRIIHACRIVLPEHGRLRHDYLFFGKLDAYGAPWESLLSAVRESISNPGMYNPNAIPVGKIANRKDLFGQIKHDSVFGYWKKEKAGSEKLSNSEDQSQHDKSRKCGMENGGKQNKLTKAKTRNRFLIDDK